MSEKKWKGKESIDQFRILIFFRNNNVFFVLASNKSAEYKIELKGFCILPCSNFFQRGGFNSKHIEKFQGAFINSVQCEFVFI